MTIKRIRDLKRRPKTGVRNHVIVEGVRVNVTTVKVDEGKKATPQIGRLPRVYRSSI